MVFIRNERKERKGYNVGVTLNRKPTKGQVGLEIEVEGQRLPYPSPEVRGALSPVPFPNDDTWSYVHDGSLRGLENAEYLLSKPIDFDDVPLAIESLWDKFKKSNSVLDDSNRTSVHVHLNAQTFHLNRLTSFMALYFIVEEILTEWCGDHRVGNLFCLRAKDAPAIISQIRKFIQNDGASSLDTNLHYSALNAHSLIKYGSLEIRTLRGVTDPKVILDWVAILERLYVLSADFADPRTICDMFSGEGPIAFFENILGDKVDVVRKGINMDEMAIRESVYEGMRLAQDLCYCRDWSLYKPEEVQPDPFGRNPLKTMRRVESVGQLSQWMDTLPPVSATATAGAFTIESANEYNEDLDYYYDEG